MNNNEGSREMWRTCHPELSQLLDEFASDLKLLAESPTSEEFQCAVCLKSRSAFTEFYSVSESDGAIEEEEEQILRKLLEKAIDLLPSGEKYCESVSIRLEDFEVFCDETRSRDESDTVVPVI